MDNLILSNNKDKIKITKTLIEMFNDRNYTFFYDTNQFLFIINQLLENSSHVNVKDTIDDIFTKLHFINEKVTDLSLLPRDLDGLPIYVWIDPSDSIFVDKKPTRDSLISIIKNNLKSVYPDISKAKEFSQIYMTEDNNSKSIPRIRLILVLNYSDGVLNTKTELNALDIPNFEIWKSNSLKFNITKHDLVPLHRLMNINDTKAYLAKYDINRKQAGKILFDDPINRYYDGKISQAYEITRLNSGEPYCRVIVPNKMAETAKKKNTKK